jgi:hypothetical protein
MFSLSTFTAKGESCIVMAYVEDFQGPYMHYLKLFLINKEMYLKVVCVSSNVYCIITSCYVFLHTASFIKRRYYNYGILFEEPSCYDL